MQTFEYRGYDQAGRFCRGLIEALSVKDAREKLAAAGTLAERISTTSRHIRFRTTDRVMIYKELSSLLSAGVPMVNALDILVQIPEMDESQALLAGVRDAVREGTALSDALASASSSVDTFEQAILQAAERSAEMEVMLIRLGSFLEERERLRARVISALIYPGIVVSMGICVAVIMLGVLLPRASELLAGTGVPLPAITRMFLAMGRFSGLIGLPLCAGLVMVVLFTWRRLKNDNDFRIRWDMFLYRLPLIGRGYTILANLRFAQTLAMLIRGGVSIVEGIPLAGKASGSPWVEHLAEQAAEHVRHGGTVSDAVANIPPLSGSLPSWIHVGEAGGGIAGLLDSGGQRYQDRWNYFVERVLSFLEPVLILIIGGFVLLVTLSILLPVISLSQGIVR